MNKYIVNNLKLVAGFTFISFSLCLARNSITLILVNIVPSLDIEGRELASVR